MARSLDAPFRREFTFSTSGFLGPKEGIYVGDIKTIYINVEPLGKAEGSIQGKIGRGGDFFNIPFSLKEGLTGAIDVSGVEYIRFRADDVSTETTITIFGYYDPPQKDSFTVQKSKEDKDRDIETLITLCDIRDLLKKIETHMSIITNEDL